MTDFHTDLPAYHISQLFLILPGPPITLSGADIFDTADTVRGSSDRHARILCSARPMYRGGMTSWVQGCLVKTCCRLLLSCSGVIYLFGISLIPLAAAEVWDRAFLHTDTHRLPVAVFGDMRQ